MKTLKTTIINETLMIILHLKVYIFVVQHLKQIKINYFIMIKNDIWVCQLFFYSKYVCEVNSVSISYVA